VPAATPVPAEKAASTVDTNSGSRSRRLSSVTRRLRVSRLKANWVGSWCTYRPRFSNHSRLAWAARWVDTTTGRRSVSYAASAASTPDCSCSEAASASASSMASLVPDPMEKCAVCAASPSSTTLPARHDSHRTVPKLIQRELLAASGCPSSRSAKVSPIAATAPVSLSPGPYEPVSKPARRHTESCISTMKVEPVASYGYACTCMTPCGVRRTSKVNASKTLLVPSHMYRHRRVSTVGRKWSAYLSRVAELTPSAATTRSWAAASSSGSGAAAW
jgi:hypothetical protein